eukprot:CAMPEP_0167783672 /NCGR_PEP_ID=MMETSP0111_2-20121227/7198_1 /TAXON_ID=91324 /ORGANISM="Lotharella globosa, Strain CCCM811" /LENGTH=89 /DNA_ID=CAMNT_0007674631 /DNA_START=20 /DNA_END=286 /DNA_ORIENTATION=-
MTIHELLESKGHAPTKENPYQMTEEQMKFIQARAQTIFQKTKEADLLMGSLPKHFASEDEQLKMIRELEKENAETGEELKKAIELAGEW